MSIFEKLGFKKKRGFDSFDNNLPELDEPSGDLPPMRSPAMPRFEDPALSPAMTMPRPSFEQSRDDSVKTDLINAKLDAIKAILENINSRIARLEKIAEGEEEAPRWR